MSYIIRLLIDGVEHSGWGDRRRWGLQAQGCHGNPKACGLCCSLRQEGSPATLMFLSPQPVLAAGVSLGGQHLWSCSFTQRQPHTLCGLKLTLFLLLHCILSVSPSSLASSGVTGFSFPGRLQKEMGCRASHSQALDVVGVHCPWQRTRGPSSSFHVQLTLWSGEGDGHSHIIHSWTSHQLYDCC